MEYNGGSVVAMVGKDCVAIAADKRFGVQVSSLVKLCRNRIKKNVRRQ